MSNPYLIQGPAQISFSGGRSSAMMLCKIVEAHGGTLPTDVVVCFANTGKEREETLEFIMRVGLHTGVVVHWIEFDDIEGPQVTRWKETDFINASRHGEPFAAMVNRKKYLPNPMARLCTDYLKIRPLAAHMKSLGHTEYETAIGLRADEPRRIVRMRARGHCLPLVDAEISAADVVAFWQAMPFDLELPVGTSNCDLCFLKGTQHLLSAIRQEPTLADWWIAREAGGKLFRSDRPNYAALKIIATRPQLFDAQEAEESLPCECTD